MMVHLVHPVGKGNVQCVQEHRHSSHILVGPGEGQVWWPLAIDGGDDGPGPSSGHGEVDGCGPLHLKHGLAVV
jgi:hypothetical protein